jgi:hypothetical protein
MSVRRNITQVRLYDRWTAYRHRLWAYTQIGIIAALCIAYADPGALGADASRDSELSTFAMLMTVMPFWTKKPGRDPTLVARVVVFCRRMMVVVKLGVYTSMQSDGIG